MPDKAAKAAAVCVLGSRVHLITAGQTVDQIERWIADRNGGCRRVIVTGFHGLWEAHQRRQLSSHPKHARNSGYPTASRQFG